MQFKDAVNYARSFSYSHPAIIRVLNESGTFAVTLESADDFSPAVNIFARRPLTLLDEFVKEHKTVQKQEATIAELKAEIATLSATVKEQAAQIQKVSDNLRWASLHLKWRRTLSKDQPCR